MNGTSEHVTQTGLNTALLAASALWLLAGLCFGHAGARASSVEPVRAAVQFEVAGDPTDVFGLFDPLERWKWDVEWEVEVINPAKSKETRAGMAFRRVSYPDQIWKVQELSKSDRLLVLTYSSGEMYDMTVEINCLQVAPKKTEVHVAYSAVAKSEGTQLALAHQLQHSVDRMATGEEGWEEKLSHYLGTGEKLELFDPLAIEKHHEFVLAAAPEEVFEAMNPAGGNHWVSATPEYVFGSQSEPDGAMWRRDDSWMMVADYNEKSLTMKTVLYIPEVEFMLEEVRLEKLDSGGTRGVVTWRVAGLSWDGNEAVQGFFDRHWEGRMSRLEESLRSRVAKNGD